MLSKVLRQAAVQLQKQSCEHRSLHSYVHGASSLTLSFETTGHCLRRTAEKAPDQEFLVFRQQNIRKTFSQLLEDARRLAAGFIALGLKPGDRVGIWGHNYYEWTLVQFATAISGMIQVNINPYYQPNELRYALEKVEVSALVMPTAHKHFNYMTSLYEVVPQVAGGKPGNGSLRSRDLPDLHHIIVFGEEEPLKGAWDFNEILNGAGALDFRVLDTLESKIKPDDPVNIQYTSGTTGFPKACTLTHHNLLNNSHMTGLRSNWHKEKHVICLPNPLYHTFGCVIGVLNALNHRQTCVFPSISYEVARIFDAIQEEKCTFLFGSPTMYIDLLSSPLMKQCDLSSVRGGYVGGAPCPYALCEKMVNELNMSDMYVIYGSTELSPAVIMSRSDQPPLKRIESVGYVMPHCELAIVDEHGQVVPRGERGELWARGYMTMLGYWADEIGTHKDLTRDRWYHTGDTATMNEDGSVMIVGRTKEMICRGGENIYPTEIEQQIHKFPYVADVQVIGVPDDRLGEAVCAWIRLREEFKGKISPENIIEACKGKISPYKIPKYVLIKEEKDFPMTATGKVKKNELKVLSKELLHLENIQSHFNE
ncbi:hypothetical protein Aduo_015661 [Ancylostoma duodenale]